MGILPGWGLSQKLSRVIGPSRAKEMAFTGNFIDAQEAMAMGLVNRVVSQERLLGEALRLANDMLTALPEMLPAYKALIDEGYARSYGGALALEQERSNAWSTALKRDDLSQRGAAVIARGRLQDKSF